VRIDGLISEFFLVSGVFVIRLQKGLTCICFGCFTLRTGVFHWRQLFQEGLFLIQVGIFSILENWNWLAKVNFYCYSGYPLEMRNANLASSIGSLLKFWGLSGSRSCSRCSLIFYKTVGAVTWTLQNVPFYIYYNKMDLQNKEPHSDNPISKGLA
jgi:hypothetical protein